MDYFTEQLCIGAQELGCQVYIANANDEKSYSCEEFFCFLKRENTFVVLLNNIGLNLQYNGENVRRKFNVPVYNFIQDHPRNFSDSLCEPVTDFNAIVLDKNHIKFINRFYSKNKKYTFYA